MTRATWKNVVEWGLTIVVPLMLGAGGWVAAKQIDHEVRIKTNEVRIESIAVQKKKLDKVAEDVVTIREAVADIKARVHSK